MLTAQSWRPLIVELFTACETWRVIQVSPPSDDELTTIGSGSPPFSWLRKAALQMYTLPKNLLDDASSTAIISWSENSAAFCFETITGAIQALLIPALAAA